LSIGWNRDHRAIQRSIDRPVDSGSRPTFNRRVSDSSTDRYARQMLLPGFGPAGQDALRAARVLVAGCGALGCVAADALARAGVGSLVIVDRDIVERTNLQRQSLFDEADADAATPKAVAAAARLRSINRDIVIEPHTTHISSATLPELAHHADLIVDGLDNFETRYLLNDYAVATGTPLIYGGAVAMTGMSMAILPTRRHRRTKRSHSWDAAPTACLRCLFPDAPPPGSTPTCDTAGVLGPVVTLVAAMQAAQAIRLLVQGHGAIDRRLLSFDLASHHWRFLDLTDVGPRDDCPCCGRGQFHRLDGADGDLATSLCGRHAVQITPGGRSTIDLAALATRLSSHGDADATRHLCRIRFESEHGDDGERIEMTIFRDARAIVRPLTDASRARTLYDRYVGG